MVIETSNEKGTYSFGCRLGEKAKSGQVFTLIGDLGAGKTVFTKGLAAGLGVKEPKAARHLRLYRYMRKGGCPSIILMFTALVMWKRWTRSDMRIIFTETASA